MPSVTVDEFFGENIIQNIALFLGVQTKNILFANAVSETFRRRKRDVSDDYESIEIQVCTIV